MLTRQPDAYALRHLTAAMTLGQQWNQSLSFNNGSGSQALISYDIGTAMGLVSVVQLEWWQPSTDQL